MKAGYGRLIVRPLEAQETSAGGIIMPRAADGLVRGTVVSVGWPDERYGGEAAPFEPGDVVVFVEKTGSGKEEKTMAPRYLHDGETYLIVLQAEVRAVE